MNRILLVDDDDFFRPSLQKNLESLGYQVISANDGKQGYDAFVKNEVDLVISDIRMPEMNGIELTKLIKETRPIPVILITGFAEILETHEAFQLGADEFIPKPFEREDLVQAIERCLESKGDLARSEETSYCRLGIEDFTSGRQILFSIFVKLSEHKYVRIAHQGEDLSPDRIKTYKQKGVHFLYLKQDDFRTYVGFNLALSKAVRKNQTIPKLKKMNLLRHTGEVLLEQIAHDGVDQDLFNGSVAFVETAVEVLADEPELFELLQVLNRHSDYLYAHSVGTSLYSVMISHVVDWTLPTNKFKVATGALLHDIGEKELGVELLQKPRRSWTLEEVKIYESHPLRSMEILSGIKSIPNDVLEIVKDHHEDCLSQGFPSRVRKSAIHPMAKLVSVANEFCSRVVTNPHFPPLPPDQALQQMTIFCADRLDPIFFGALMKLFHFTPTDGRNDRPKRG